MRTIARVDVFPVRLPMTQSFQFASGSAGAAGGTAPHVFVKITDSEGAVGWGEGRPVPQWSYETLESVTSTIHRYLGPAIQGLPITDRWELHHRLHQAIGRGPSTGQPVAKAAVDLAVHDLCARHAGMSLRSYLGGSDARNTMALSYTLTGHDPAALKAEVAAVQAEGFRHFNFKVGIDAAHDIAAAQAVRDTAGQEAFVWADANQGYDLHTARHVAQAFTAIGVDVLEQPLPADQLQLMRALRTATTLPLAVDEASVSPADFFHYAAEGLVDYFVIKLTRSGGVWPTLQQIAIAAACGQPLLVSGLTDGLLTKVAVCQVALAVGFAGPAALNGSQFIDESALYPNKSAIEYDGAVHLHDQPGIGVAPDESALHDFRAEDVGP